MSDYSRRLFLKHMGLQLTLPVLSNFYPLSSMAAATQRKNFIAVYFPNGSYFPTADGIGSWHWNDNTGVLYDLTQGADSVQNNVMILRKINAGRIDLDPHWHGPAAFLSGDLIDLSLENPKCGRTIDQMIADTKTTPIKSLEVGGPYFHIHPLADHPNYPDIYINRISWTDESTPRTPIIDPYVLFNYLFYGGSGSAEEIEYMINKKKSILDVVQVELARVSAKTSSEGKIAMQQYENGIREIELSLASTTTCTKPSLPTNNYENKDFNYIDRVQQFQKMIVFALKCDLTNVVSLMYGPGFSSELTYKWDIGFSSYEHHDCAHNGGNTSKINRLLAINKMQVGLLKHLLNLLKDNGLINDTLVYFASDMSNGDTHDITNIPTLLCGGGSDLKFGQEITFGSPQKHTQVLLSALSLLGVNKPSLGEDVMLATTNINSSIES
ncbi:MAG: DUF1552 domain-containing protein [Bdellovibrionaceae bacterium]|nr:DUF1552 domain-containing protein [Pseudobdellovibrionaceae bacterium]